MPNPLTNADAASPATPAIATRRGRPRALPTFVAMLAVVVFVAAGRWQGSRMHETEALRAQLAAATAAIPVPLESLRPDGEWAPLRYRPVVATGEFDARNQIFVDNKVHAGRAGYHVVTPLMLGDGRAVLVNRGWVAQAASRATLPVAPLSTGIVTVHGRLALPAAGYFELASEAAPGPVWQNLDPARFGAATGRAVLPVVIEATVAPVPDDGLVRDWPAPDFGIEKHRIYMLQWYALATLAAGLWLFFALRRFRSPT
jgi:surfeit locus 1 family protein